MAINVYEKMDAKGNKGISIRKSESGGWCDGDHVFKWLDYNKSKLEDVNFLHIYIGDYAITFALRDKK